MAFNPRFMNKAKDIFNLEKIYFLLRFKIKSFSILILLVLITFLRKKMKDRKPGEEIRKERWKLKFFV